MPTRKHSELSYPSYRLDDDYDDGKIISYPPLENDFSEDYDNLPFSSSDAEMMSYSPRMKDDYSSIKVDRRSSSPSVSIEDLYLPLPGQKRSYSKRSDEGLWGRIEEKKRMIARKKAVSPNYMEFFFNLILDFPQ